MFTLKLFAVLGCGLVAGVFFAFSAFVMSALARLQPAQGIAAMQSINITAMATNLKRDKTRKKQKGISSLVREL